MTNEIKLRACPFCGDGKLSIDSDVGFDNETPLLTVHCSCGAEGTTACAVAEAIAAWNRRAPNPVGHEARRRAYQEGHRDGVKEAQAACMAISASVVNHEVVRMTAAKCAFAIKALATEPAQEPNRSQKMHEAGYTRRPSPFGCEECGMVFGGVAQLQAHDCTKPAQEGDHV